MSKKESHVVIGGTGNIGQFVVQELLERGKTVTILERRQKDHPQGASFVICDVKVRQNLIETLTGATHVYLCVGLPYERKVWKNELPTIIQHCIDACLHHQSKLIYLDNIYMYGPAPLEIPFTENSPQQPSSEKGKIRKYCSDMILNAIENLGLKAVIGRAADFYGPGASNSYLYIEFLEKLVKGKSPAWLFKKGVPHTYACTTDIANALVKLAEADDCLGQVWHLPVGEPVTIEDILTVMNASLNLKKSMSILPRPIRKGLSFVIPVLKEVEEVSFQFDQPYSMSWDKLRTRFPDLQPTPAKLAVQKMVDYAVSVQKSKN